MPVEEWLALDADIWIASLSVHWHIDTDVVRTISKINTLSVSHNIDIEIDNNSNHEFNPVFKEECATHLASASQAALRCDDMLRTSATASVLNTCGSM